MARQQGHTQSAIWHLAQILERLQQTNEGRREIDKSFHGLDREYAYIFSSLEKERLLMKSAAQHLVRTTKSFICAGQGQSIAGKNPNQIVTSQFRCSVCSSSQN